MPGIRNSRKRVSVDISDDDQQSEASFNSSSNKRARLSPDASQSPAPTITAHDDDEYATDTHQPGSLVRVKLVNFVTYTAAEFHLGPSLNMIIGPNGTGKSTLVCAICLGLGWSPQHLGRAKEIGEFVKHGHDTAEIEIELAAGRKNKSNPIIRRVIKKEGNKSAFFIDNHATSQKQVVALARSFSIQIDNLCQFLPQDRVVEFAKLDPISLLRETQRAAAPQQMVEWHDELKGLRTEEKGLEKHQAHEDAELKRLKDKQNSTREDVERYNQRQELALKSKTIEKCRPIINMKILAAEVKQLKADLRARKQELVDYEAEVEPLQTAQREMETYRDEIDRVAKIRTDCFNAGKNNVEQLASKIKSVEDSLAGFQAEKHAEKEAEKTRRLEMKRIEGDIKRLTTLHENGPVEYDPSVYEAQKTEFRGQAAAAERRHTELASQIKELSVVFNKRKEDLRQKREARANLDTQSGQQGAQLKKLSKDTFQAWDWLEKNMTGLGLRDRVYAPPIISCSVPEMRFANIVESQLRRQDVLAITCTNAEDAKIVTDKLLGRKEEGGLELHSITIRTCPQPRANYHSPLLQNELEQLGFDGWISDYIQGPDPVLAMLCDSSKLHRAAYASRPISSQQYHAIHAKQISKWVGGTEVYQVTTRREYNSTSTTVSQLRPAQFFTDQPVDSAEKQSLDQEIENCQRDLDQIKSNAQQKQHELAEVKQERKELEDKKKAITEQQEQLRKALAEWEALPRKITAKEKELQEMQVLSAETYDRLKNIQIRYENATLMIAALNLDHTKALVQLRVLYEAHLEAEIRLIEARSEVQGYANDNSEISRNLERKSAEINELSIQVKSKSAQHKSEHAVAKRLMERTTQEEKELIKQFSALATTEDLDNEIAAIAARLDLMAEGNPDAIKAFEKREKEIQELEVRLATTADRLETVRASIREIREQWEPELDSLISKISDGFSHNFEQIGCLGQVGVYKDEDFEKWSVQIKVSFREGEPLSILDSHRQSGGERAVSTIFYLMALQDFARSPFRVVDEINQGMDPRNERMVHGRMVDIACRERTSQYFLITPKLLDGLKFHPKMTVHCIASGEHMPDQRTNLDFQQLAKIALRVRGQAQTAA